jgi:hypothetical protein
MITEREHIDRIYYDVVENPKSYSLSFIKATALPYAIEMKYQKLIDLYGSMLSKDRDYKISKILEN